MQAVVITDPVLATQILRNKAVDKLRFMYSFLDVVRKLALCRVLQQHSLPSKLSWLCTFHSVAEMLMRCASAAAMQSLMTANAVMLPVLLLFAFAKCTMMEQLLISFYAQPE